MIRCALRSTGWFAALVLAGPVPAGAQLGDANFPVRLSLTPYLGLLIPTRDLIDYQNHKTRLSVMVTWGGRLGLDIKQRVSIDAGVAYSPGSVEFLAGSTDVNERVHVLSGSGRVTLFLLRHNAPFWIGLIGGVGAVRHTFHQAGYADSLIRPGTRVGALVGVSMGVRLGRVIAFNVGAEDHVYTAYFDVQGTKTSELRQHDIRIVGGVHIPFLGF